MKIVIVGAGKVGQTLTEQLSKEDHDLVVIDKNMQVLQRLVERFDVMVVQGNGAVLEFQKEADVGSCDILIAATSSDEINLLCCILAKKLGVKHTIARVRNPEYAPQLYLLKEELGLSMTINPERAAAAEIFRLLQLPTLIKRDSFARGRVEIVELKITQESGFGGLKLRALYEKTNVKVLVCAVERDSEVFIPNGDFELQTEDKIYVTAATSNLRALIEQMGFVRNKVRDVIIIGGSRIAFYLTQALIQAKINVKVIESNYDRCLDLAEKLPKALVISGDGSQREVLAAEGIDKADAVVTLTNIDEENLIISMFASHLGAAKTITKINRIEYKDVFNSIGIDSTVSPKLLTANEIVRYVRAMAVSYTHLDVYKRQTYFMKNNMAIGIITNFAIQARYIFKSPKSSFSRISPNWVPRTNMDKGVVAEPSILTALPINPGSRVLVINRR